MAAVETSRWRLHNTMTRTLPALASVAGPNQCTRSDSPANSRRRNSPFQASLAGAQLLGRKSPPAAVPVKSAPLDRARRLEASTCLGESRNVDRGQDPLLSRHHPEHAAAQQLAHRPRRRLHHDGVDRGPQGGVQRTAQHGHAPRPAANPDPPETRS